VADDTGRRTNSRTRDIAAPTTTQEKRGLAVTTTVALTTTTTRSAIFFVDAAELGDALQRR
jgi:hypothetical protein